jgi:hypothetical protein
MSETAAIPSEVRQAGPGAARVGIVTGMLGTAGLAVGLLLGRRDGWDAFFRAYLLNYCYVLSLSLGALAFVMIQHATRAGWSVALRRLAEQIAGVIPFLALLFLPLLIPVLTGMTGVYEWSNAQAVAGDGLLRHKQPYLNPPFFVARCVVYFAVWIALARFYLRRSVEQDATGDVKLTLRMQAWSGPGLLLYGLTVTFFAIDALMSLNPHWYSTIFGVYFFSGCLVGFFALLALLVYLAQRSGWLTQSVTIEHFHDVGKLAFGFTVFWAYIAFSQYLLIWYGNIPEETVWYQARQAGPWWVGVSLLLLVGHFVAPFLALLARYAKRNKPLLAAAAVWLLLMHWLDLYYLVAPRTHTTATPHAPGLFMELVLLAGLGGWFTALLLRGLRRHALLPVRDPRLAESLTYRNE